MNRALRMTGFAAIALVLLGELLPWTYRSRPAGEVWDSMFSQVTRPNAEWWIWLLAPLLSIAIAARELLRDRKIPMIAIAPAAVFFATWAALILTGVRHYTGLRRPGFLVTFIGLAAVVVTAVVSTRFEANVPRTALKPRLRS